MLVGPVVHARQAVAANGDAARALVPRQHQDDAHVGEPGAQALVVVASEPGDGCCDDARVRLQAEPRFRSDSLAERTSKAALCALSMSAECRHPCCTRSSHQTHLQSYCFALVCLMSMVKREARFTLSVQCMTGGQV